MWGHWTLERLRLKVGKQEGKWRELVETKLKAGDRMKKCENDVCDRKIQLAYCVEQQWKKVIITC